MITKKTISDMASQSKYLKNGKQLVLWPDGSICEADGPMDLPFLITDSGMKIYPVMRIEKKVTKATVKKLLLVVLNVVDANRRLGTGKLKIS